jgi:hypothetical protein
VAPKEPAPVKARVTARAAPKGPSATGRRKGQRPSFKAQTHHLAAMWTGPNPRHPLGRPFPDDTAGVNLALTAFNSHISDLPLAMDVAEAVLRRQCRYHAPPSPPDWEDVTIALPPDGVVASRIDPDWAQFSDPA